MGGTQSRAASPLHQIEPLKVIQDGGILVMTYCGPGADRMGWRDYISGLTGYMFLSVVLY